MSLELHQLPGGTFWGIYTLPRKEEADFRFGKYIPPREYDQIGAVFIGRGGLVYDWLCTSDTGDALWAERLDFDRQFRLREMKAGQEKFYSARKIKDLSGIPYFDDIFERAPYPKLKKGASFDFAPILKRLAENFTAITEQYVSEPARPVLDSGAGRNTKQKKAAFH